MKIQVMTGVLMILSQTLLAQHTIHSQVDRLHQYAGNWVSSIHADTDSIDSFPIVKMNNHSKMGNHSLQVEVLHYQNSTYQPLLTELISHDSKSDQIIALGQNAEGVVFNGTGRFANEREWQMQDIDMLGDFYLRVKFDFQSYTEVLLEGFDQLDQSIWKTRYIKSNPKDKNIGIQLVSVHQQMLKSPVTTLRELSRMATAMLRLSYMTRGHFTECPPPSFVK
ncbi:hypothetical protein BFP72_00715 [Reichenbachiella sp. 5M10]|uniref:hypothetical protein n=1 Tax=Reichenbachiella sp. 5M10 TaxID=1889772 RepID=UPI000C3D2C7C|nr:hypothetical protein [Reichenbachiella sp. 5M10]PIB34054.1 hypothetical protein BFP72_00715 [Reichenbachiella sp. 5M10]